MEVAKSVNPTVPPELTEYIVGIYVHMREEEQQVCVHLYIYILKHILALFKPSIFSPLIYFSFKNGDVTTYTGARSLLSILRLASALVCITGFVCPFVLSLLPCAQ